jgi:hypothetical protein
MPKLPDEPRIEPTRSFRSPHVPVLDKLLGDHRPGHEGRNGRRRKDAPAPSCRPHRTGRRRRRLSRTGCANASRGEADPCGCATATVTARASGLRSATTARTAPTAAIGRKRAGGDSIRAKPRRCSGPPMSIRATTPKPMMARSGLAPTRPNCRSRLRLVLADRLDRRRGRRYAARRGLPFGPPVDCLYKPDRIVRRLPQRDLGGGSSTPGGGRSQPSARRTPSSVTRPFSPQRAQRNRRRRSSIPS